MKILICLKMYRRIEEYETFSKEVLPHINAIIESLKRHDVEGLATVTADKTGYFNLSIHSSGFSLYKTANDGKVCIEHVEELDLLREEDK